MRRGAGNIIFRSLGGPNSGQKGSILFLEYFFLGGGEAAKLRWREGAQRPVWRVNEPKKTGARSARARTRGHSPLVKNSMLRRSLAYVARGRVEIPTKGTFNLYNGLFSYYPYIIKSNLFVRTRNPGQKCSGEVDTLHKKRV